LVVGLQVNEITDVIKPRFITLKNNRSSFTVLMPKFGLKTPKEQRIKSFFCSWKKYYLHRYHKPIYHLDIRCHSVHSTLFQRFRLFGVQTKSHEPDVSLQFFFKIKCTFFSEM